MSAQAPDSPVTAERYCFHPQCAMFAETGSIFCRDCRKIELKPCPFCGEPVNHTSNCWFELRDIGASRGRLAIAWNTRASIPQASAEHQQRAKDQNAHDIGMAHIICDQAGIPPGEIIGRLVALSGKGDAKKDQGFVPPPFAAPAFSDEEYAGIRFRFFKLLSDAERLNVFRVFLGLPENALAEVTTHYVESKLLNAMLTGRCRAQGGITSNENEAATPQTAPSQAKAPEPFQRETAMSCPSCCAKAGEPHKPGCTEGRAA